MSESDESDAVKLARMQQQIQSLVEWSGRIERKVDEVVTLDRTIVKLQSDYAHQAREMQTQWVKIDATGVQITAVEQKVDRYISFIRGAGWAAMVIGAMLQAFLAASIFWVFNSTQDLRERTAVLENRKPAAETGDRP